MKKYFAAFCLLYTSCLFAGLGDPYTYTLTNPPKPNTAQPTPFDLIVPPWPTDAPLEHLETEKPFKASLSTLRRPQTIRVENAPGVVGFPVLCHVQMNKHFCQANYVNIVTDNGEYIRSPIERLTPESYVAVGGFADYFDLGIFGTTPCEVTVSCEYIAR